MGKKNEISTTAYSYLTDFGTNTIHSTALWQFNDDTMHGLVPFCFRCTRLKLQAVIQTAFPRIGRPLDIAQLHSYCAII